MNLKIFEANTVKQALKNCLDSGIFPATVKQIYDWKKEGKLKKDKWYSTSTIYINGEIRTATLEELKDIESLYERNCRVLFVDNNYGGLDGNYDLNNNGRFVGVKPEGLTEKNHCCKCGAPK